MNLDETLPLPLEYSEYVKTAAKLVLLDNEDITQKQLLIHMQSVCIVYACLAVKRNAGILDKESKLAAAAKGYEEIAVPGFFRWARDNDIVLPAWLTVEKMGCSTLTGAPILFKDGAKLWSRFDTAMRVMKRDFNPIWDRYIKGQLGKNTLPSGQTGDDAIDNLLDGLHAQTPGTVDCPLGEDDLVEATSSGRVGGAGEEKIDGGGEGGGRGAKDTQQGGASGKEGRIDGVKQESEDDDGNGNGEGSPEELGDANDYPERPKNWMHQYLMIFCLIGRPSSSEDPDLATARKTSGPPGRERTPRKQTTRGGKRKAGAGSSSSSSSSSEDIISYSSGAGSNGNLDSTAIRTFAGAGEAQSRAQVKKESAAVAKNVASEAYRQKRLAQTSQLAQAVVSLSESVAAKRVLDEEAAVRAREVAARARKDQAIRDLQGRMALEEADSPLLLELRAALRLTYNKPVSAFMDATALPAATPASAPGAASPATSAVTSSAAATASPGLPGFAGAGAGGGGAGNGVGAVASSTGGTGEMRI